MAERVVHFSDLSGAMITDPAQLAEMVIVEHPDIDQPVKIEATPDELSTIGKLALKPVVADVRFPGEEEPTRYYFTTANFTKISDDPPMKEVVANASPFTHAKRRSGNSDSNGDPRDNWGMPKRGRTSPEEGAWVRANLELVNQRRVEKGIPPIDPAHPDYAHRYGFVQGS